MDARGNCAWFGGSPGTGKTHEAMEYAKSREKRIITYDWTTNNESYNQKIIQLDDLDYLLPEKANVRIQDNDFEAFVAKCQRLTNATINIDDCTALFSGSIPNYFEELLYKRKNQRLDFCLQFHTIASTPPDFLRACNLFFIKATSDSMPLKGTTPNRKHIEALINECHVENRNYKPREKWATRLLDTTEETISVKDVSIFDFLKSYNGKLPIYNYMKVQNYY